MKLLPFRINAGFFSNNQDIHPDPAIIQKMYGALAEFNLFPGSIPEIEPIRGQLINRLKFNYLDNSFNLIFGLNRLDFQVGISPSGNGLELTDYIILFKKILLKIDENFPRTANRLSLVCNFMLNHPSPSEMNDYFKSTFNKFDVAPEIPNRDWSFRATYNSQLNFNDRDEKINKLFLLQRIQGFEIKPGNIQESFDKIELQIDINTSPEDINTRFKSSDAILFYEKANQATNEFADKILEKFNLK